MKIPAPTIYWVRRDLRVSDNKALKTAADQGPVIPVYFVSNWTQKHLWTGPKRQHFLCQCLHAFAGNLQALGGRLIVRNENPVSGLEKLINESGAHAIHYQADPDPFGKQQEKAVAKLCGQMGIEFIRHYEVSIHEPDELETKTGNPYRVYTPFSKAWMNLFKDKPICKPKQIQTPQHIQSDDLPTVGHWGFTIPEANLVEAGERAARKRLKNAIENVAAGYSVQRDIPSVAGTSRLSQDLRHGLLSARSIFASAQDALDSTDGSARDGIFDFIKEIAWREFYMSILHHWPEVLRHEFNPDWRGLPWHEPSENYELWKEGRTGFPIVDAGMRELLATGHMHNRVRMITAMFLTKDLHIDWRLGESFFMQHLIDGEIASNNGGWQWSAGTGADAAPYFRIQNPWSQTKRYDPQGLYIKRWVPELANVDAKKLLEAPANGKPIADGYPLPCVDHKTERDRTLMIFKSFKEAKNS